MLSCTVNKTSEKKMCLRFVTVVFAYAGECVSDQTYGGRYGLGSDLLFGIGYFDIGVNMEHLVQSRSCVVAATKLSLMPMSLLVDRRKTQVLLEPKTLLTTHWDRKLNIEK